MLPPEQRIKDHLFVGVVRALSGAASYTQGEVEALLIWLTGNSLEASPGDVITQGLGEIRAAHDFGGLVHSEDPEA